MMSPALGAISNVSKPTKRELEVLEKIAQGMTSKQIASALNISFKTAVTHRANLLNKLDVHNAAFLVRRAIALGYLSPHPDFPSAAP
jgi:DNA-binding NarL/FixJ family response regulator